jgi:hypothetical protein
MGPQILYDRVEQLERKADEPTIPISQTEYLLSILFAMILK